MSNLIYEDLTYKVRGILFKIHNTIGSGYREKVYCQAIIDSFYTNNISFKYQEKIPVVFDKKTIAKRYVDFIVEDKIILEIKVGDKIPNSHFNQLKEYLNLSGYKLGLLVVFRQRETKIFRIVNIY